MTSSARRFLGSTVTKPAGSTTGSPMNRSGSAAGSTVSVGVGSPATSSGASVGVPVEAPAGRTRSQLGATVVGWDAAAVLAEVGKIEPDSLLGRSPGEVPGDVPGEAGQGGVVRGAARRIRDDPVRGRAAGTTATVATPRGAGGGDPGGDGWPGLATTKSLARDTSTASSPAAPAPLRGEVAGGGRAEQERREEAGEAELTSVELEVDRGAGAAAVEVVVDLARRRGATGPPRT